MMARSAQFSTSEGLGAYLYRNSAAPIIDTGRLAKSENNIFVDLFKSGGGMRFLYSVPPEGKTRKTTLSLKFRVLPPQADSRCASSTKFLNHCLEIKPR
jgi:hypothetical protein